ncbi:MAG: hypothetical protein MUF54_22525, partial [Polyangiaceae bacterium]|nr:hypothetical protein [Polyangiaceae bacterium]
RRDLPADQRARREPQSLRFIEARANGRVGEHGHFGCWKWGGLFADGETRMVAEHFGHSTLRKILSTDESTTAFAASSPRISCGTLRTYWRTGTSGSTLVAMCIAVAVMRRVEQLGHSHDIA